MLYIGWFSSGKDKAARELLRTVQENIIRGEIEGKITFVFSNREPGETEESDKFFQLVQSYGLPLICLSHRRFRAGLPIRQREGRESWRLQYDREIERRIANFAPDLCVLAGYMLIVGEELCRKYNMINLHPAPPGGPTGSWQEVIWSLIHNRADTAGAMIHLVTPELDRGPVISYCLFSIKGEPFEQYWQRNDNEALFHLIRQHELARELPLITVTLQSLCRKEIVIKNGKIWDTEGKPISGYDFSARVDEVVRKLIK